MSSITAHPTTTRAATTRAATASTASATTTRRLRVRPKRVALNGVAVLIALVALFPVYWMVITSFKRGVDIQAPTPSFLPIPGTLGNYRKVFERDYFWTALANSLMVTAITVVAALVIAFLAAVALSRFRFRGRAAFLATVLVVQMIPAEALVISLFRVLDGWQLVNTVIGLSLTYLVFVLPFTIWTLRGFVDGVPFELEEAAMVDGASRFAAFRKITFPLVAPGLVATAVFSLIQAWNEFIFALVIMNRPEHQTLPVWVQAFNEGARGTDWGGVMAGSTIMAIPVIVFFLIVQRKITTGLTAAAVKG
jgi:N,N'-diacetylchitobiose transport system permease protein